MTPIFEPSEEDASGHARQVVVRPPLDLPRLIGIVAAAREVAHHPTAVLRTGPLPDDVAHRKVCRVVVFWVGHDVPARQGLSIEGARPESSPSAGAQAFPCTGHPSWRRVVQMQPADPTSSSTENGTPLRLAGVPTPPPLEPVEGITGWPARHLRSAGVDLLCAGLPCLGVQRTAGAGHRRPSLSPQGTLRHPTNGAPRSLGRRGGRPAPAADHYLVAVQWGDRRCATCGAPATMVVTPHPHDPRTGRSHALTSAAGIVQGLWSCRPCFATQSGDQGTAGPSGGLAQDG